MNYFTLPQSLVSVFNLADRVATSATAAAHRAITTYRWLTQPQAIAKYKWLGAMTLALIELTCVCLEWLAIHAWLRFAKPESKFIVDYTPEYKAKVSNAIADLTDAELEAEFNDSFEPDYYAPGHYLHDPSQLTEDEGDDDSDRYVAQPAQEHLAGRIDKVMERKAAQPQAMAAPVASLSIAPSTSHQDSLDREFDLAYMTVKQLVLIAANLNLPTRKVKKADLIASILEAEGYQK